ncbi:MAG TPA: hypothetical protein VOA87_04410 [Thermoanaerobaculia bacterium]|nr:hypothetical protein [Thermoanaerobaculia bacterium]
MNDHPPRWAELALSLLLKAGDRESIPGDLLEKYREEVLPRSGWWRSQLWYARQLGSLFWHLLPSAAFGVVLGLVLSAAVVAINVVLPLLPEAASPLRQAVEGISEAAGWLGVLALWGVAGFFAWRRHGTLAAALKAGALVSLLSMGMVMLTFALVDNLFLDLVSRQPEKLWGFQHSEYHSMRAYINHGLLRGLFFALPVMAAVGAALGGLGGLAARFTRRPPAAAQR